MSFQRTQTTLQYIVYVLVCLESVVVHSQSHLTEADKQELLNAINNCRSSVSPIAANMLRLVWSSELSHKAQSFAEMCKNNENLERHSSGAFGPFIGETLALTTELNVNYTNLVNTQWNGQRPYYDYTKNRCYTQPGSSSASCFCMNYLQMIQAQATHVGCGAYRCPHVDGYGADNTLMLVCNYGPGMNISLYSNHTVSMQPYLRARGESTVSCSDCPAHMSSCVNNLCTSQEFIMMGSDPHFSVLLPCGHMLCFSVQGEDGRMFNLLSNDMVEINALFSHALNHQNNTFLGSVSVNCFLKQHLHVTFTAKNGMVSIKGRADIPARSIDKITFKNDKVSLSRNKELKHFGNRHIIRVEVSKLELKFSVRIVQQTSIDLTWHEPGRLADNTNGLVGQFFRSGIEIDIENQMLHLPGKSPVPVKLRPIWKFMAKEVPENPVCWTTVKPSNQGEGLIQGQYKDYEVYSLIPVAVDV